MLNYKQIALNRYYEKLRKVYPLHRRNFLHIYSRIRDPIVYVAFLIFFVHNDNWNHRSSLLQQYEPYSIPPEHAEFIKLHSVTSKKSQKYFEDHMRYMIIVVDELEKAVKELGNIEESEFVEAWRLLDIFNDAEEIIKAHYCSVNMGRPIPQFLKCVWLYQVIDFIRLLRKDGYPVIAGWDEFIRCLLELSKAIPKTLSFADYAFALRNGNVEFWYQRCIIGTWEAEDWKKRYVRQLQKMDCIKLAQELDRRQWGRSLVKCEIARRAQVGISV